MLMEFILFFRWMGACLLETCYILYLLFSLVIIRKCIIMKITEKCYVKFWCKWPTIQNNLKLCVYSNAETVKVYTFIQKCMSTYLNYIWHEVWKCFVHFYFFCIFLVTYKPLLVLFLKSEWEKKQWFTRNGKNELDNLKPKGV